MGKKEEPDKDVKKCNFLWDSAENNDQPLFDNEVVISLFKSTTDIVMYYVIIFIRSIM